MSDIAILLLIAALDAALLLIVRLRRIRRTRRRQPALFLEI